MKTLAQSSFFDAALFFGMLASVTVLVASLFVVELRALAVPALAILFGTLVYGLR
jgi:hypothetical protein